MHMANELLSPAIAAATGLVAAGGIAGAARRIRDKADTSLVPLMGVLGAFVFAAQMINFTLPALPGTSDHLIGTTLLAVLLGPSAAVITMTGVLVVQCLIFQDGGLLALGANVINMGLLPAYGGYAIWRVLLPGQDTVPLGRMLPAVWTAAFVAVTLGAVGVCIQVGLSQRLTIPLAKFSAAVIGVHFLSGAFEGLITGAVLVFLYRLYPNLPRRPVDLGQRTLSVKGLLPTLGVLALVIGGVVSWFASPYADGLEWAIAGETLKPKTTLAEAVDRVQDRYTPLPDYNRRGADTAPAESERWPNVHVWTSLSGLLGVGVTLAVIGVVGKVLTARRRARTG